MSEKQAVANEKGELLPIRTQWLIDLTIGVIGFIFFNVGMIYLSIPSITSTFQTTDESKWILLSYLLSFIFVFFLHRQLLQRFGARQTGLIGISLFAIGSALGGTALLFGQLIFSQLVQGLGASLFLFALLAVTNKQLTTAEVRKQQQMITLISGIIGLLLGGLLVELFHWHMVFLINVPVGLALYYLCLWLLPSEEPQFDSPVRSVDAFLSVFLLLFIAFGLSPYWELWGIPTFLFFIVALGIAFFWWKRQKRWSNFFDLLPPDEGFGTNVFVPFLHAVIGSALAFLLPFFFSKELKWDMLSVGMYMIIFTLTMAGVTSIRKRFLFSLSKQALVLMSTVVLLIGLIFCLPLDPHWNAMDLIIRIVIFGVGYGLYPYELPTAYLTAVGSESRLGNNFVRYSGWFLGPVLCTLIWTPNMVDRLSNRMDMRIALFILILLALSSMIVLISRKIMERSGDKQTE